ncbi:MAG: hypothetical protein ACE5KV_00170 [Thermoplasmata archaeon]
MAEVELQEGGKAQRCTEEEEAWSGIYTSKIIGITSPGQEK